MDTLDITGLSVAARIGIHAWEQKINQRLLIDLHIATDMKNCEDNIANALDYSAVCQQVTEYTESKSFQLIETVANEVAELIKTRFNINEVRVSVSKPHAIKTASNIKVTVTR